MDGERKGGVQRRYRKNRNDAVSLPEQIDTYNYEMGNVDIADQLRLNYWMDFWLRNRK